VLNISLLAQLGHLGCSSHGRSACHSLPIHATGAFGQRRLCIPDPDFVVVQVPSALGGIVMLARVRERHTAEGGQ